MIELIAMCAPDVAPEMIQQIIKVESNGDALAIHINHKPDQMSKATSIQEAVYIAKNAIESGYSVDMGLMQINSQHLKWLGVDLSNLGVLFTPCANIAAGAALLKDSYNRASLTFGVGQDALKAALSEYNTGSFTKGFKNGYLARYTTQDVNQSNRVQDAIRSSTDVHWNAPSGYYVHKEKGDVMDDQQDQIPSKKELDEFNVLEQKKQLMDIVPGLEVAFDPDEAEIMGAFVEDAMSLEDALDASTDPREAE